MQVPSRRPKVIGQVSTIEWLPIRSDPRLTICFGTALGYLCVWRQTSEGTYDEIYARRVDWQELLSIEADKPTLDDVLFAFGTLSGHVAVWKYDNNGMLKPLFALRVGSTIPRRVAFSRTAVSKSKSKERTVVVFGAHDGMVHTINVKDGTVIETQEYRGPV
jgi:hypothetical protein